MRGVPSRTKFPWPAHSTPARGLMAVPAFPMKSNGVKEKVIFHVNATFTSIHRRRVVYDFPFSLRTQIMFLCLT
jgi:hypothetical protein